MVNCLHSKYLNNAMQTKEKNVEENPRGINASEFQLINNQNREIQIL